MPTKTARRRSTKAKREDKAPSTQASAYVRDEMRRTKDGRKGVKNRKQAIAIGLSKARRDGIKVPRKKRTGKGSRRKSSSFRT